MEIAGLEEIDWTAPWFAAISERGRAVAASSNWRGELDRAAQSQCTFVGSDAAGAEPYEVFIARTRCVPTRANLHDFFNALIWLRFPGSKAQLNRLQSAAITRDGVRTVRGLPQQAVGRGALRDALTLIDENAVLLVTRREDIVHSLRAHDWPALFQRERGAWTTDIRVVPFGHALLEKLVRPYAAVTAHALHVPLAPDSSIDAIDRCMAATLDARLAPRDLLPLPVLGIPGWSAQNEDPRFYADRTIFRPAKMRRPSMMEKQSNETRRS